MSELYIGLISGTSADGIDAVIVDFEAAQAKVIAQNTYHYPDSVHQSILELAQPTQQAQTQRIDQLGHLDQTLGELFADAAKQVCALAKVPLSDINAIGSHGQTVRHRPKTQHPFTLQLGDPNVIAWQTQTTTVADFRRMDMAAGGQGAPLVPLFHQHLFHSREHNRIILNLGGIANMSWLGKSSEQVIGFDTGPANALTDLWILQHLQMPFDDKGLWASKGQVSDELLKHMLADPYFQLPPPKSTGREYFDEQWLNQKLKGADPLSPEDVQATLVELTAKSIGLQVSNLADNCDELYVCGGGAHNDYLLSRIKHYLPTDCQLQPLEALGFHSDFIEAATFAWLAKQRLEKQPVDYRPITGASAPMLLGALYQV